MVIQDLAKPVESQLHCKALLQEGKQTLNFRVCINVRHDYDYPATVGMSTSCAIVRPAKKHL